MYYIVSLIVSLTYHYQMLFSHLYVTLVSLGDRILDPKFWASYCNQVIYMKLFLFFYILFWLTTKDDLIWTQIEFNFKIPQICDMS